MAVSVKVFVTGHGKNGSQSPGFAEKVATHVWV